MSETHPAQSESLLLALQSFANADSPAERRRLVEAQPELLGEEADAVIAAEITKRRGMERSIRIFEEWRALFARCRREGVEAAFGEGDPLDGFRLELVERLHEEGGKGSILAALAATTLTRIDAELQPVTAAICRALLADTLLEMEQGDRAANLNAAIVEFTAAIPVLEDAGLTGRLLEAALGLSRAHQARACASGSETDSAAAVDACAQLGWRLLDLYHTAGRSEGLDAAVHAFEQALAIAPPGRLDWPGRRFRLAIAQSFRFSARGDPADINAAIEGAREAIAAADASDARRLFLSDLSLFLHTRYDALGDPEDLDAAIHAADEALACLGPDDPERPELEGRRGMYLHSRSLRTGSLADLETALGGIRSARSAAPEGPEAWASWQDNLGVGLRNRFAALGEFADIDEAIEAIRAALAVTPRERPDRSRRQMNLGVSLLARFEVSGRREDVDAAIEAHHAAVADAPPSSPDRPRYVAELGIALRRRFEATGRLEDLRQAGELLRQALASEHENPARLAHWAGNLGAVLLGVARATGDPAPLDGAVRSFQTAASVAPEGSRSHRVSLMDLGTALQERFDLAGAPEDRTAALEAYAKAWNGIEAAGWPEQVLSVGRALGRLLMGEGRWEEAAAALDRALDALELLYGKQLLVSGREGWLAQAGSIYRNAAYALARVGSVGEAAVRLERGRAGGLGEALERDRTDLVRLRTDAPGAYGGYLRAVERLREVERIERTAGEADGAPIADAATLREAARAAADGLRAAVETVREVPGYKSFLDRPGWSALAAAADPDRPLVYLAATEFGTVALIVRPTKGSEATVEAVHLDAFRERELHERTLHWFASSGSRNLDPEGWHAVVAEMIDRLGDALITPVAERLAAGGATGAVLVPCGLLGLLPLHAALPVRSGADSTPNLNSGISYAPSARALVHARRIAAAAPFRRLVAVDEPRPVPGAAPLPNSGVEVAAAAAFFADASVLRHTDATRERVLEAIRDADVVHLSCHGATDAAEPLRSALAMAAGEPLSVRDLLDLELHGARLAVLSACETGMIGSELPDEVVGLPSALARAGFAGVVASLWGVPELSTALLLERFYEEWLRSGDDPARALDRAGHWLRGLSAGALAERFRAERDRPDDERKMPPEAARDAWLGFAALEPDERPFEHPVHWAAFAYTGA